jgi:hypothetical protein
MPIRPVYIVRVAVLIACLSPVPAFAQAPAQAQAKAQDAPKMGLVAASSGTVGFIYQFNERLAVRPTLGFSHNSTSTDPISSETSSTSWAPGVSVLFYSQKWDAVRAYVSPGYEYSHTSSSFTTTTTTTEGTANTNLFSGSVGAQYDPHPHFGAFGEVGLAYSHRSSQTVGSTTVGKANAWAIRAAVGAIFYF